MSSSSSSRYSLRSNAGCYALRSKGASPPPIQSPKSQKSRSAGKLPLDKVPRLQDYLNPTKPMNRHRFYDDFFDSDLLKCITLPQEHYEAPKEDLNDDYFLERKDREGKEADTQSHEFATAAISYLREQGGNFELVRPGRCEGATISTGARFHHNFMAKRANDSSAPEETFFAQLRYFWDNSKSPLKDLTVECCVSLGKSDSLPDERARANPWCGYCSRDVDNVHHLHHPVAGCAGIEWGNGYPVQKGVI